MRIGPRADGRGACGRMRPSGPKSGRHAGCCMRCARPLSPPRRISARLRRAVASPRPLRTGTPARRSASATSAAVLFASATHSSIVASCSGTNGTTSTAPMRGCTPSCVAQVDRRDRRREEPKHRLLHGRRLSRERVDGSVVRGIGRLDRADARPARRSRPRARR